MKLATIPAAALAFAASFPALAADFTRAPPAAPYLPPAPVVAAAPLFTWNGIYAGLNVGAGLADRVIDGTGPRGSSATRVGGNGVLGGAQVGYNYQYGPAVIGAETDFQGSSYHASYLATSASGGPGGSNYVSSNIDWFGTARGRLGYAAYGNFLPYVTGGYAYGRTVLTSLGSVASFSQGRVESGWTVGGGVEYAFGNALSVKAEYLYVDLGRSYGQRGPNSARAENTLNVARLGMNYKYDVAGPGLGGFSSFTLPSLR